MIRIWLKELRKAKKLTMREVATIAGISECYYSQIENGKRNVSVNTAQALAQILEFDWQKFYD